MASKAKNTGSSTASRKTAAASHGGEAENLRERAAKATLYTKTQILDCERYAERRDLLTALLEDRPYSTQEVEGAIELYMKKGVN